MNENVIRRTISLVHEAGKIAKDDSLRKEVAMKGNCDFVTAVDTGISAFLKEKLKKISGKEIILIQKTDPALLAGVRVELDGKLLDGTVKNRISEISDKIHHATV